MDGVSTPDSDVEPNTHPPKFEYVHKPRRFFRLGRVFATRWAEPWSEYENQTKDTPSTHIPESRVFKEIRRFIVVHESQGAALCVPIHTYGGRGTGKDKIKMADHAKVYPDNTDPPNRELPMREPVGVVIEARSDFGRLHPASVANFGKIYTVEHDAAVAKIGYVPKSQRHRLQVTWKSSTTNEASKDPNTSNNSRNADALYNSSAITRDHNILRDVDSSDNISQASHASDLGMTAGREIMAQKDPQSARCEMPTMQPLSNIRYENEEQAACHRLFKTSQYEHFKDINPSHVPNTCEWLLSHPQYIKWRESSLDELLWVSADPGCGKSVLSRFLVDDELRNTDDHIVCYFFFKNNIDQEGLTTALCAILHQFFDRQPRLLKYATTLFEKNGEKLRNEVDDLWRIFIAVATRYSAHDVSCVIDALDECRKDDQPKLFQLLTSFYSRRAVGTQQRKGRLKFLVTSRPYQAIEDQFRDIPRELPSIRLAGEECSTQIREDIDRVIQHRLNKFDFRPDIRQMLENKLTEAENRTYLWVHLILEYLNDPKHKRTKKGYEKAMRSLPRTVEEAYENILSRLNQEQRLEAETILHIVVGARRCLTFPEMEVALELATEGKDARVYEDLDLNEDCLNSRIRNLCGLFIFEKESKIHLIHETAREFLIGSDHFSSQNGSWKHSLDLQRSNEILAEVCVTFLSLEDFNDRDSIANTPEGRNTGAYVFLEYSALYWPQHYRHASENKQKLLGRVYGLYDEQSPRFHTWYNIFQDGFKNVPKTALELVVFNEHFNVLPHLQEASQINIKVEDMERQNLLDCAGDLGVGNAAQGRNQSLQTRSKYSHRGANETLIDKREPIAHFRNSSITGFSSVRSLRGSEKTMLELLDRERNIIVHSGRSLNALQVACAAGHMTIVQALLERGADINMPSGVYGSPLQAAAAEGHEDITRLLLKSGAKVNFQNGLYGNALQAASRTGHYRIVKLLLENGADADAQGGLYGSALQAASIKGPKDIIQLLLGYGANINARGGVFGNALQAASAKGHEDIVCLLLKTGANPNAHGGIYGHALQAAAIRGHERIIHLLLDHGANINDSTLPDIAFLDTSEIGQGLREQLLLDGEEISAPCNLDWSWYTEISDVFAGSRDPPNLRDYEFSSPGSQVTHPTYNLRKKRKHQAVQ